MNHEFVCTHLGLDLKSLDHSLSSSSEVYRVRLAGRDSVLKSTRSPIRHARHLAQWLRRLQHSGVGVVAPIELGMDNPFGENDCYVVYPFIKGRTPTDSCDDYFLGGQLLGSIWQSEPHPGLVEYRFTDFSEGIDGVLEDLEILKQRGRICSEAEHSILEMAERTSDLVSSLAQAELPRCGAVWDYKAANLVFHEDKPVLIDPDSCGYLPRILDLALAFLLWPNDCLTLAGRLPDAKQWQSFHAGLLEANVVLSDLEWQLMDSALQLMFLDEALYLLVNDEAGFQNPRQCLYLQDLIRLGKDGCKYPLRQPT